MIKNKYKIIIGVLVCFILSALFFCGEKSTQNTENELVFNKAETELYTTAPEILKETASPQQQPKEEITADVKEEIPQNEESAAADVIYEQEKPQDDEEKLTCTLSVSYKSVFENLEKLKANKKDILIEDGMIFEEKTVEFFENESVFDLLHREMKNNGIHFEFSQTPMYNSAYIEGIGNLYEFDCGEYSGWIYRVNGVKPTYGCSQYKLQNGDKVEFYYSCNFLKD